MIRRHPLRPSRRQPQDFHFFAATSPIVNLESQFARPAPTPVAPPIASDAVEAPELPITSIQLSPCPPPPAEIPPDAPPEPVSAKPEAKPRSKPRARKRAAARLATPRRNRPKPPRLVSPAVEGRSDHERHCTICSHADRAEIENEFMHWHGIGHIAYDYKVSRSAIYRHAYALGLFSRRNRNLRFALGHLIERVQDVEPTADSVVRAIHAFARINDEGEWTEPPAHVIVSSGGIHREAAAPSARCPISIPLDAQTVSKVIDVPSEPVLPGAHDALLRDGAVPGTVNRVETDATR
jgi:hypothetical protein